VKIIYNEGFNYKLGPLKYLHPFDGMKFQRINNALRGLEGLDFISPAQPVDMTVVDEFLSTMMRKKVRDAVFVFRALEVPKIPFVGFSFLDKKILSPMRWGVAATLFGAERALAEGGVFWNLSGGYHHAMQQSMEGFCIYNDIGICHQQLVKQGLLAEDDKILVIDTDAHHGNGNAYAFMDAPQVTLLDVYNAGIYPTSEYTRERVNIPVKLMPGSDGKTYLSRYSEALEQINNDYKLAFVVAGTDVLLSDKLGGLCLTSDAVAEREKMTLAKLESLGLPAVMLGGGGYSKESALAVTQAIKSCVSLGF
jgi:histone deacetylase 11